MSDIFNENRMMQALGRYLPEGEVIVAGIHGIGLALEVREIFGKCSFDGERLVPDEHGITLEIDRGKYASYDVYIGVTEHYLILAECEECRHLYDIRENPDTAGLPVRNLEACVLPEDVGNCFLLAEIQSCVIKKVWMGAFNCMITMKNGSRIKLQLPKRGGLGGGMPHHAEYREKIMEVLGSFD